MIAGAVEGTEDPEIGAAQNPDLPGAADVEKLLSWIRRERDPGRRTQSRSRQDHFTDEPSVPLEHLNAGMLSIADIHEPVVRDAHAVNGQPPLRQRPLPRHDAVRR